MMIYDIWTSVYIGVFMTEKEEKILQEIITFYNQNKLMPSIRYLQKKFGYKSTNSISQYLISLEQQKYLIRNSKNKLIINNYSNDYTKGLKIIKSINSNDEINILLNKNQKYLAFKLKNNAFYKRGILKGDLLIIEKNKKINNNDLGLFIINKKYRIMQYLYQDGFYILEDNEQIILNKIKLIGKVIQIERKIQ